DVLRQVDLAALRTYLIARSHNLKRCSAHLKNPYASTRMPIEVGIWRIGDKFEQVTMSALDAEERLEEHIAKDLSILAPQLMLIGRQVATAFGKFIDLLAIDAEGKLIVIELKRDRTPREIVAQV